MASDPAPPTDCALCPRLADWRRALRADHAGYHNAPVPSFGPWDAPVLIVGLAPGLHGANRTGRPFTGDGAGDTLYPALIAAGFAAGTYGADPADGLVPRDARITNAVRCVPPGNKPLGAEVAACNRFLRAEIAGMGRLRVILALGGIAHHACLDALGLRRAAYPFRHGALHRTEARPTIADCYHVSRLNTNTGRLTPAMVAAVLAAVRREIGP
ncbi:MAG: uracil-DNA glycosylase [Alphaproteobacteria bacterium]|nr:uracil-DNA glycosylase [Alphaproteobacteria bacterium]